MIACRYVGWDSSRVGDREFDEVGQRAVFSERTFYEAVVGGAAFVFEEDFKNLGITRSELESFGPLGIRVDPSDVFCEKVARGQQIFRELRDRAIRDGLEAIFSSELVEA